MWLWIRLMIRKPSVKIENGVIVEMDQKRREEFDFEDTFIADHAIDLSVAEEVMAMNSLTIARMMVDINVGRSKLPVWWVA